MPIVAPVNSTVVGAKGNEELLPVYYSQLYVHKNSTYTTLQELQGCVFAYNDDASLSGYHCLRFLLNHYASTTTNNNNNNNDERKGEGGQKKMMDITIPFFSRTVCTGGHVSSMKAIAMGNADVACIDCVVVQDLLAKAAAAAAASADDNEDTTTTTSCQDSYLWYFNQLRPLHAPPFVYTEGSTNNATSSSTVHHDERLSQQRQHHHQDDNDDDGRVGPNPAQPIVISANINIDLRNRIQRAYLSLHDHTSLSCINATHFVSVTPRHYEAIDAMMQECEGIDIICSNEGMMMEVIMDDNVEVLHSNSAKVIVSRRKRNVGHCYKSPSLQ